MRFLGTAGYYRLFCPAFSQLCSPLIDLLSTKRHFNWTDECQNAFETLRSLLSRAPVLQAPDLHKAFALHVDASDVGVGAMLLQADDDGVFHPVCYYSYKLKGYKRNYVLKSQPTHLRTKKKK